MNAVEASRPHAALGSMTAALLTTFGLLGSWTFALLSDGVHHDDDLTHLLFAQWAWHDPRFLLDEWGRPGFTVLYVLPAHLGWPAARLFSGLLTAAAAWLAYSLGRRAGTSAAWLAPALLWLQPLTFSLSFTTLTEPVLAFYLTAAAWLLAGRRFIAGAAVLSLCAVTRHEAAVFLPVWIVATWRQRHARRSWPLLLWAPLLHNVLGAALLQRVPLLMFLEPKPTDYYRSGGWLSMALAWIECSGPGLLMLAAAGAPLLARRAASLEAQRQAHADAPRAALGFLLAAGAAYFLAHTVVHRFGLFASGGYARFLVPIGPALALCAAEALGRFAAAMRGGGAVAAAADHEAFARDRTPVHVGGEIPRCARNDGGQNVGVPGMALATALACAVLWAAAEVHYPQWLWWGLRWPVLAMAVAAAFARYARPPRLRAATMAILPTYLLCTAIGQPLRQCTPHRLTEDQWMVREATDWIRVRGLDSRPILTANVWVDWFLHIRRRYDRPRLRDGLDGLCPGDLLVWDARYCTQPPNELPLAAVRARPDLVELWHGGEHSRDGIYCYIFEKRPTASASTKGE